MSSIREWVLQVRYPYTAGTIAVIWVGTAFFMVVVRDVPVEYMVLMLAAATLIIANIGFSSRGR